MFKVSSKGRYAVKAVYELATQAGRGPVTVASIAHAQNIPEQYLEQLMPLLKRAGLVSGTRGAQGGYQLMVDATQVSVRDVVAAVEGPIVVADCTSDAGSACAELDWCIGPDVWVRVQEAVDEAMSQITMDQLMREQRVVLRQRRQGTSLQEAALTKGG